MRRDTNPSREEIPERDPVAEAEAFRRSYRLPDSDDELLAECRVTAYRASGPGGQHRNTTLSAVRLVHEPSGIVVIGRRERSQSRNLKDALGRLRDRLGQRLVAPKKRRRTKPGRESREKRLEEKKKRGAVKRQRSRDWED